MALLGALGVLILAAFGLAVLRSKRIDHTSKSVDFSIK